MPFQPTYQVPEDRRAYTLEAGPTGCLMLHGFMGSPKSSRPLAEFLAGRGVTVHCPLLPGHGELPNKIYRIPRQAWIDEAVEALADLRRRCPEIFIMSHSMGSVLAAYLADKNPDIRGLIMLAPLYDVPDKRIRLLAVLRYIMPWFYPLRFRRLRRLVYERIHDFDPTIDPDDPALQSRLPEMTRVPTSGIDEMRKMADFGRSLWPRLRLPAIIFQGEKDVAVSQGNAQNIYDLLASEDKKLHIFAKAGHELMRPFDPLHEKVWTLILEFIQQHSELTAGQTSKRQDEKTAE